MISRDDEETFIVSSGRSRILQKSDVDRNGVG